MGHTTFFDSQLGLFLFRNSESFSECCIVECKRNLIFSSLQLAKTSATANSNFDASSVYSFSGIYRTTSQEAFNLLELTGLNQLMVPFRSVLLSIKCLWAVVTAEEHFTTLKVDTFVGFNRLTTQWAFYTIKL